MSARKWPIYTMAIGQIELIEKPPKRFLTTIQRYQVRSGKLFRTKRVGEGREVRRVA